MDTLGILKNYQNNYLEMLKFDYKRYIHDIVDFDQKAYRYHRGKRGWKNNFFTSIPKRKQTPF